MLPLLLACDATVACVATRSLVDVWDESSDGLRVQLHVAAAAAISAAVGNQPAPDGEDDVPAAPASPASTAAAGNHTGTTPAKNARPSDSHEPS